MRSPNSSRLVPAASHSVQVATASRTKEPKPRGGNVRGTLPKNGGVISKMRLPYLSMSGGIVPSSHLGVYLLVRADILVHRSWQ
jgi:hypothetical protein